MVPEFLVQGKRVRVDDGVVGVKHKHAMSPDEQAIVGCLDCTLWTTGALQLYYFA